MSSSENDSGSDEAPPPKLLTKKARLKNKKRPLPTNKDSDSSGDESPPQKQVIASHKKPKVQSNDADEGKTLFIRNLSFQVDEEQLKDKFLSFGTVVYAKVVKDYQTQHSKGMAFVKFENKDDADSVLLRSSNPEHEDYFSLDNRVMNITLAVNKDKVKSFTTKEKSREEKREGRNLHLARTGMIRPGTQEAEGMSKEDARKREEIMLSKKEKLKNPSIFISTMRLCVRNLPTSVQDKELLTRLKALGGPSARITECRIMRDLSRVNSEGKAKSRGYGFVAFDDEKHALKALHSANNKNIFGGDKRLIVEFSLENTKALETRKRREFKSKAQLDPSTSKSASESQQVKQQHSGPAQRPEKHANKAGGATAFFPKHFGAKNRRRDKAAKANRSHKPKGKISRKQKATKKRNK